MIEKLWLRLRFLAMYVKSCGQGHYVKKSQEMHMWNMKALSQMVRKQNRSTEGCSKLKRSVDMTSSGKNGLNIGLIESYGKG